MVDAVDCQKDRGELGTGDLAPEGLEDGPGDLGVAGAKLRKTGECGVGGERDGKSVFLRDEELGEDRVVGFGDLAEKGGGVDVLGELKGFGAGDWSVGGCGCGYFLGCEEMVLV